MVQENAPEREALKIKLFAEIDSSTTCHPGIEYFRYPYEPHPIGVQAPGALRNRTSLQSAAPDSAGRGAVKTVVAGSDIGFSRGLAEAGGGLGPLGIPLLPEYE
jgi:hypothetical protein